MRMHTTTLALTLAALVTLSGALAPRPALADRHDGGRNDADEILEHIERVLFDVEQAQRIVNDRPHHPRDEYSRAQQELRRKEAELERARIDAMSAATGVPRGRVISMRAHGRSWEGIALDLGVSPRVVGLPGWYGDGPWAGHPRYYREHWRDHGPRGGWHDGPHDRHGDHRPGPRWRG